MLLILGRFWIVTKKYVRIITNVNERFCSETPKNTAKIVELVKKYIVFDTILKLILIINSLLNELCENSRLQIAIRGVFKETISVRIVDAILVDTSNKTIKFAPPRASKLYFINGSIQDWATEPAIAYEFWCTILDQLFLNISCLYCYNYN